MCVLAFWQQQRSGGQNSVLISAMSTGQPPTDWRTLTGAVPFIQISLKLRAANSLIWSLLVAGLLIAVEKIDRSHEDAPSLKLVAYGNQEGFKTVSVLFAFPAGRQTVRKL